MRIVHVADHVSLKLGYHEYLLAKWQARQGHEVHLVTSDLNPPAPNYAISFEPLLGPRRMAACKEDVDGVMIHRLPALFEYRTRVVLRSLGKVIAGLKPDAVYAHGVLSPTAFIAARAAERADAPLFLDSHMLVSIADNSRAGRLVYALSRPLIRNWLLPRVHQFYGVADECCDYLVSVVGIPAEMVQLLPLGVDTDLFAFDPQAREFLRRRLDIPPDALVIGQTGKMDASKDPMTLVRALVPVMEADESIHAVFVGAMDADTQRRFDDAVGSVVGRVRQHAAVPVSDLAGYFSALDIVVFPGGTSMSSLEAAACQRIVVMNDMPASLWRSKMGVGPTFARGDDEDLRYQLSALIAHRDDFLARGAAAREAVVSRWSYQAIAEELSESMQACVVDARGAKLRLRR